MEIKLVRKGTEGIVFLEGRLDSVTSADAEKTLKSLTPEFNKLVLDFTKLDYISSAGLRILKILYVEMTKKAGRLVLRNVNSTVMEVFKITGFQALLDFE